MGSSNWSSEQLCLVLGSELSSLEVLDVWSTKPILHSPSLIPLETANVKNEAAQQRKKKEKESKKITSPQWQLRQLRPVAPFSVRRLSEEPGRGGGALAAGGVRGGRPQGRRRREPAPRAGQDHLPPHEQGAAQPHEEGGELGTLVKLG